jgi:hypothetical protein
MRTNDPISGKPEIGGCGPCRGRACFEACLLRSLTPQHDGERRVPARERPLLSRLHAIGMEFSINRKL